MQHNDINITNNKQPNIADIVSIFLYSCKVKLIIFEKTVMEGHLPGRQYLRVRELDGRVLVY